MTKTMSFPDMPENMRALALAWLLSEIDIPNEAQLPAGITGTELREWLAMLVKRFRQAALPP